MNNIMFNYWLQGFFEIMDRDSGKAIENELAPILSEGQVACIREHIELVKKTEPLTGFAAWLEGYLDARVGQVGGDVGTQGYLAISERLKESFVHMSQAQAQAMATLSSLSSLMGQTYIGSGGSGGAGTILTC